MKAFLLSPISATLAALITLTGAVRADELRVSAAASLADVLKEVNAAFAKESGTKVRLNLGASSLLARQIGEGAPVDVFFSADEAKMDGLEKKGLIDAATRKPKLSNTLVVVVPSDSTLTFSTLTDLTLPGVRKIATGDPKSVPVGVYAREHLEKLGLWAAVQPKIVSMENVRAALAAVESGNAEAGIVYKTDATASPKVKIALEVPAADGPRIVYPVARVTGAAHPGSAAAYLMFLDSSAAHQSFVKFGFVVLPEPADKTRNP